MASIYGNKIKVSIFGESHSRAIGVTVDGLPAGFRLDLDELRRFTSRRAPGGKLSTPRREADEPVFLSGIKNGVICGSPLTAIIENNDTRSADYEQLRDTPRPGHADYTAYIKYGGSSDFRGGGHFSGRLTAPLCIAGAIAVQLLAARGIRVGAHVLRIADIYDTPFDLVSPSLDASGFPPVLDSAAGERMSKAISDAAAAGNSVGGVIECAVTGLPAGVGEPMFDGMESRIAAAVFAVPAVKGVEFGAGFATAAMRGSESNDAFYTDGSAVYTKTNNCGGILGGITNGMPLIFRAALKPTPSIAAEQDTVSLSRMENVKIRVGGRHDPCVVVRAVPAIESAAALAVLDAIL